jgi:hypothetical protein
MRRWHRACALGTLAGTGVTPTPAQGPARGRAYWDRVTESPW